MYRGNPTSPREVASHYLTVQAASLYAVNVEQYGTSGAIPIRASEITKADYEMAVVVKDIGEMIKI
jgi:hypothetical protein